MYSVLCVPQSMRLDYEYYSGLILWGMYCSGRARKNYCHKLTLKYAHEKGMLGCLSWHELSLHTYHINFISQAKKPNRPRTLVTVRSKIQKNNNTFPRWEKSKSAFPNPLSVAEKSMHTFPWKLENSFCLEFVHVNADHSRAVSFIFFSFSCFPLWMIFLSPPIFSPNAHLSNDRLVKIIAETKERKIARKPEQDLRHDS